MLTMHISYIGAKLHWWINFTHFSNGWPLCLSLPPSQIYLHIYANYVYMSIDQKNLLFVQL